MDQLLNDFSPGLFFMQAIILLILILLMGKFAWKPIMNALNEREEGIKNALDEAENAKKEMQSLKENNEALLKEARSERDAMLKEARELKDKIVADAKQEADEQANTLINNAKEAIETEKAALAEIKNEVALMSIQIAEKIINKELSSDKQQLDYVNELIADVKLK